MMMMIILDSYIELFKNPKTCTGLRQVLSKCEEMCWRFKCRESTGPMIEERSPKPCSLDGLKVNSPAVEDLSERGVL